MAHHTVEVQIDEPYKRQGGVQPESSGAHRPESLGIRTKDTGQVLRRAAQAALAHQQIEESCELTVVVTDDEVLHELNLRHRDVDAPTDVLAFPDETRRTSGIRGPFVNAPGLPRYLGDVIVSFPRAKAQAAEAENELLAELQLLVVHGVLHLLGYDDQTEPERARMWKAQRTILDDLGVEVHLSD